MTLIPQNMFQLLAHRAKGGLITLIYKKKGDPSILKFWQPITLLTVDYKILSKILTTRLSKHMNDLLNPYQSSGPKERDIIDNILNIQTINIRICGTKSRKSCFNLFRQ